MPSRIVAFYRRARRAAPLAFRRLRDDLRWLLYRVAVDQAGAAATEYSFLIAFISILGAIGMVVLGDDLRQFFDGLALSLDNAAQPTPDPFAT